MHVRGLRPGKRAASISTFAAVADFQDSAARHVLEYSPIIFRRVTMVYVDVDPIFSLGLYLASKTSSLLIILTLSILSSSALLRTRAALDSLARQIGVGLRVEVRRPAQVEAPSLLKHVDH